MRARAIATRLNCDLAIIDKRRERAGVSEVMNVIGDVEGRDCILVDDIVDSGGTLCNAAEALIDDGARSASVYVTHGVLSGGAVARIASSPIEMMTITDQHPGHRGGAAARTTSASSPSPRCWPRRCGASPTKAP